jgi:cob(I)alamin adenosyltransferase
MEQGLLHLYWGDGKGKTTAAMGLALRALGSGKRVVIVQFLKGGNSGEIPLLAQLGAEIYRGKAGQKFVFQMTPEEKAATRELQNQNLRHSTACRPADTGRSRERRRAGYGGRRSIKKGRSGAACWV